MSEPRKERGPKLRMQVTIPADLVAVAKIESALRILHRVRHLHLAGDPMSDAIQQGLARHTASVISAAMRHHAFDYVTEDDLQQGVQRVLNSIKVAHAREHRFNATDRVDFLTHDGLAIELKIDGTRNEVLRQMMRYAEHDNVHGVMLITTCSRHRRGMPDVLRGKPLTVHQVITV